MKKILLMFIMLSILLPSIFAQTVFDPTVVVGKSLPSSVARFFSNERIQIEVKGESTQIHVIIIEKGIVKEATTTAIEDATIKVYTTKTVIDRIFAAKNPVRELRKAIKAKEITYKGVGFVKKTKIAMALTVLAASSWFEEDEEETTTSTNSEESIQPVQVREENNASAQVAATVSEVSSKTTHEVKLTSNGFEPETISIKVGDTIKWENTRSGTINTALIIGVRSCRDVRSKILKSGESYEYTFNKEDTCSITDGVMTKKQSQVTIEQ